MFVEQNCLKGTTLGPASHLKASFLSTSLEEFSQTTLKYTLLIIFVPSINSVYTTNDDYLLSTYYMSAL